MIDRNAPYGSIMRSFGIFIDRYASPSTLEGLITKMDVHPPGGDDGVMDVGNIV